MKFVKNLIDGAIQIFYPSLCRGCERVILPQSVFCVTCIQDIKPLVSVMFPITTRMSMTVFSAGSYDGPLKTLVLKKFYGDMLASKQLARVMLAVMPFDQINADIVVPIPLHWWRYAGRGYNQSVVMAQEIGNELCIQSRSLLMRKKKTVFQSRLSAEQRKSNLDNAFVIHPWINFKGINVVQGKNILLVDDLCTTGSTLVSAAKALLELKPKSITAVVGCRAIL